MSALGTKKRDVFADAKRNFDHMVTEHAMTILRDDELYRHIRCWRPGTSLCGWDLITWPGHLVVTGDVESFHFAREADMFGFFEMCGNEHGINPDYWGEKIQGSAKWRTHSPELFAQLVVEHFWERRHSYEGDTAALWRAIREDVLIHAEYAVAARDALMSFQHWDRQAGTFEFSDAWEWSFLDADWHYLRSLHAIVWGIRKYRAAKAES